MSYISGLSLKGPYVMKLGYCSKIFDNSLSPAFRMRFFQHSSLNIELIRTFSSSKYNTNKSLDSENMSSNTKYDTKLDKGNGHENTHDTHIHEGHDNHSHEHEHKHKEGHTHSHNEGSIFGHSHTHHGPNELLAVSGSAIKTNPAVRITWVGLLVNIGLAASKGLGGLYFHSQSLLADAVHSLSDMVADILTLATVNISTHVGSPTKFPLGYGKIETVGSVLVSGILLFAGVSVGWSSLLQIFEYTVPTFLYEILAQFHIGHSHSHSNLLGDDSSAGVSHSHSHSHSNAPTGATDVAPQVIPNMNAAWLAGASIIIKELLYRRTIKIANDMNSKVLVANAWHHRIDSMTALVAVITVAGGNLFNVAWLDSVGGLCVSVLIIKAGWATFKSSVLELLDRGEKSSSELYENLRGAVLDELENLAEGVFEIEKFSVLNSGAVTNLYITLGTKDDHDLSKLNDLDRKLVDALKKEDKFVKNVFISYRYHT